MYEAFSQGKIKSFSKTPSDQKKVKAEPKPSKMMIKYHDESAEATEDDDAPNETRFSIKSGDTSDQHHIIIEPYTEYEDESEEQYRPETPSASKHNRTSTSANTSTPTGPSGMQSNELFLKSLQATLDKLPDDKNMRARIKIQEILYTIAYEK